ncbi:beta-1,3-glucanase family protein [uncultured Eubacterium sp.]|nr:beta-1,3-glucanase family protein [uncultured Eubacterium sp.]
MAILLTLVLTLSMANGLVFNVSAASPKLNKKKVTITVGKTVKLKVKKNKAKKKVKWKSANKKIVKVTKKGKIKGIKPGKTVVTAKVGKKKLKCKVKVVAKKQTTKPTVKPTVPATTKAPVQTTQAPVTTKAPVQTTQAPVTTKAPVQTTQAPVTTKAPVQTTKVETTKAPVQTTKVETTKAPVQTTQAPVTTKVPVQTTQAPTTAKTTTTVDDGKPGPKEAFGQSILGIDGLSVQFVWGNDNEIISSGQTFNIYYDGVLGEQGVKPTAITHVFATGGKHVITIKGYLNGKESQGVDIKVDLGGSGDNQTTTKAPVQTTKVETTTKTPVQTTQAPTTAKTTTTVDDGKPGPKEAFGQSILGIDGLSVQFVWGNDNEIISSGQTFNIYYDGVLGEQGVKPTAITHVFATGGKHVITIKGYLNGKESQGVDIKVDLGGSGDNQTTTNSSEPTKPSTTQPTTTKPATTTKPSSENPTTGLTFTTDSSIAKPFGMKVEAAGTGYLRVVWGRGDIDCYNVYVDGERRRTGVSCGSFTLPVYTEGTHTVAVATVVGNRESVRVEETIAITGVGERETEPETCPEELKPQLKENVPMKNDRIAIELNNKTNGKYSDNEIYWCIVGKNANNQLCYLDKDGNMIPASESLNTVQVGNDKYANIYHTLAEADYVYTPTIRSGRMYISYGKPVYLKFVGTTGYAGPDLNNPGDVNANTLFEFAEFTIEGKFYWGNTTRVDYFCFPMITRLVGSATYGGYDKVVGDIGTRDEIFNAFKNEAPEAFKTLVRDDRIMAPCKSKFNVGEKYGNYFDNYINEFWNKYSRETLQFSTEAGNFTGRVVGNQMQFTKANDSTVYTIDKPTTQDVLEGKGAFDKGNGTEKAIEAQLCAAFNRGVATEPDKYYKPSEYYKNSVNNFYAGFFHRHSVLGFAYGFCYDDVNDQSTLLQYDKADALVIDLKW